MDAITRMAIQGVAVSVFIAAGAFGAVRAAVVAIAADRYFEMRAARYPESADLPRPRLAGRDQLLIAAALCWPAAVIFTAVRISPAVPSLPWIVLAAAGFVAGLVALVVSLRSPSAKLRGRISAAARAPLDRRDDILATAFELDPQLKELGGA